MFVMTPSVCFRSNVKVNSYFEIVSDNQYESVPFNREDENYTCAYRNLCRKITMAICNDQTDMGLI